LIPAFGAAAPVVWSGMDLTLIAASVLLILGALALIKPQERV
jgi:hypothetical protein